MKKFSLLIILIAGFLQLHASLPNYHILQVDKENPNLRIRLFFQDPEGFIWIGSDNGLYRYDGFTFDHIDLDSLSGKSEVSTLSTDSKGNLIAGFSNGTVVTSKNNRWSRLNTPAVNPVNTILQADSTIWMATYGQGIFYRNHSGWHSLSLPDLFIYSMVRHSSGVLLAGTDQGLVIIDPKQPEKYRRYDSKRGLPDNIVKTILCTNDGEIWLGMEEAGICLFDIKKETFTIPGQISNWTWGAVKSIVRLQNEFWIGTEKHGIIDYEFAGDKRVRVFSRESGMPYVSIQTLMRDREGNIWISAENKLLLSPGEKIEVVHGYNNIPFDSISAIAADHEGYLWFANRKGLFRYSNADSREVLKQYLTAPEYRNLHIVSLHIDDHGYIWIGTFDNGLFRLNPSGNDVQRFGYEQGLANANVISIAGTGDSIWLATLGGITLCIAEGEGSNSRFTFRNFEGGAGNNFVYTVFIDSKHNVWFGTDGKGLIKYADGRFQTIPGQDLTRARVIYSVIEDHSGNIWFSTSNHGLFRYDGSKFLNFGIAQGLREAEVSGLGKDYEGNIIAVHHRGIDLINPSTFSMEYIGAETGLINLDPDLNVICSDQRGGTWIGTQESLIRYYNYDKNVSRIPETRIRRIYAFMKPGSSLSDSVFKYNQNQISIEYIGLWYSNPDAVNYRYRLEGYNKQWINTRDRIVTFPSLPPGHYTFRVMSSRNNDFRESKMAVFSFVIHQPLWREWWFILTVLVITSAVLIIYLNDRVQRFRRIEGLKKEKIEYQYETLKSQVNPHFLFNSFNTLIGIIEDDRDLAVEYVEKLSDYFRSMIQYRDQDTITLAQELRMVSTYYFLQKKRFGDYLTVDIDVPDEFMESTGVPPLSLQLLIENAVKHNAVSFETPLHITVRKSDDYSLIVTNNLNPKKTLDPSTGIGLENIINRFRILTDDEVKITRSSKEFRVQLPLIKLKVYESSHS